MDTRTEHVLLTVIDNALDRSPNSNRVTPTRDVVDLLLDLRLVVIEVTALDRLLTPGVTTVTGPPAVVR
jgi:hypothetical protein